MAKLEKARLLQLTADFKKPDPAETEKAVVVQFNPETLKISFANQIQQPEGNDQKGGPSALFVGAGTTKLTCTLWFDVTAPQTLQPFDKANNVDDVRKLTNRVSYFITPGPAKKAKKNEKKLVPPPVRFSWGSLLFDGIMESVEESLEFFSPEGRPLRASVAIAMTSSRSSSSRPRRSGLPKRTCPAPPQPRRCRRARRCRRSPARTGRASPRPTASRTLGCRGPGNGSIWASPVDDEVMRCR